MNISTQPTLKPSFALKTFQWFLRLLSIYALILGINYWMRLIGFYPGDLYRFDIMPVHWQVATSSLAVLYPFAAIGLWMLAAWGPVVWFICAGAELVMHVLLPQLFGTAPELVMSNVAIGAVYIVFRLVLYRQDRVNNR